jgi:hypothetical protein
LLKGSIQAMMKKRPTSTQNLEQKIFISVNSGYFHLKFDFSWSCWYQESTGLESLLGQALTLEDEPTLVRAVKSVKRSLAQNEEIRNVYVNMALSSVATVIMTIFQFSEWGIGISLGFFGITQMIRAIVDKSIRFSAYTTVVTFVMGAGVATLGTLLIEVKTATDGLFTRDLPVQRSTIVRIISAVGGSIILSYLVYSIYVLVTLKLQQRKKAREEELKRQQKLRGIFYTPVKPEKGKWNFNTVKRDRKSHSVIS